MDWWDNQEKELDMLIKILDEQKEAARVAAESNQDEDEGPQSEEIVYRKIIVLSITIDIFLFHVILI